jgi:hypothetical protein
VAAPHGDAGLVAPTAGGSLDEPPAGAFEQRELHGGNDAVAHVHGIGVVRGDDHDIPTAVADGQRGRVGRSLEKAGPLAVA